MAATEDHKLERGLSLTQATAINMIDMVGIGPFIAISMVLTHLSGPLCLLAWLLGAVLAYTDGMVWAELGAKWPEAGGSYVFLQKLFGDKWGKLMAFLFIWQTVVQAPLTAASSAIGFSTYLAYLIPSITEVQQKCVSGAVVALMVFLLYRNIKKIGAISLVLSIVTVLTILWMIFSAAGHFSFERAFTFDSASFSITPIFFVYLGQSSVKAVYSYMGYYNVCHLGAEIKDPERNIPRSMFISITGIMILYLCMQLSVIGVIPWQEVGASKFIVSTYFELIYNHAVAQVATVLVLCIALASLFSLLLGYSRVPYAAALNGDFFPVFAKVHPKHKFPHISLLTLGALAFVFSLLFRMSTIITTIVTMRILIQFVSQAIGVMLWHKNKPDDRRPYKMPLFPLPAIISACIWLYLLLTSDVWYVVGALGFIATGVILYFVLKDKLGKKIEA
ncbi:APC family permease [Flavipsychrobacter stenotrophus]|nr:APC family permease [Flavipsychrobacter stenotrophus]